MCTATDGSWSGLGVKIKLVFFLPTRSGTISREEVVAVCKAMKVHVDERDLEEMITRYV